MKNHSLAGTADVVIVGGGIAGLTAAVELAAHRAGSIVLLEQDSAPGRHSTALNASLLLQLTEDPVAAKVAIARSCLRSLAFRPAKNADVSTKTVRASRERAPAFWP